MRKRFDGRDEEIIEPDLEIVDAHHHLFDRPAARYLLDEITADLSAGHRVTATVYVESHAAFREDGPEHLRPVGETEVAAAIARASAADGISTQVAAAIVGFADLALGAVAGETLDAHLEAGEGRFRGVRQVTLYHPDPAPRQFMFAPPPPDVMRRPAFREGFAELARRGLSFDAAVFHTQLSEVMELADAFPDTVIVLDHAGFAMGMGLDPAGRSEVFGLWRAALSELAHRPNVVAKVGGFGMPFWGFGFDATEGAVHSTVLAEAWRPYVETTIDLFGPERCMMESNFPLDGFSCGYVPLWNALKRITRSCSAAEKASLYAGTVRRVYRFGG